MEWLNLDSFTAELLCIFFFFCYVTYNATLDAVSLENGSKDGNNIGEEALGLISDGLESKIISVLQDLLASSHPEQMVCLIRKPPYLVLYGRLIDTFIGARVSFWYQSLNLYYHDQVVYFICAF